MNGYHDSSRQIEAQDGATPGRQMARMAPAGDCTPDYAIRTHSPGLYTLQALLSLMWRRKTLLAVVFTAVFGAAVAIVMFTGERYQAESKLLLRRDRGDVQVSLAPGAAGMASAAVSDSEISAEIELLRSRDLLEEVAIACKLAPRPKAGLDGRIALAKAVQALEANLKTAPIGKTNLILLQYTAEEPERAAEVLNELSSQYLRKHVAVHRSRDATEFLQNQTSHYQRELSDAQAALNGFQRRADVSLLGEQKQGALRRVMELESALQESESQIRDAQQRAGQLRRQRASLPPTIETQSRIARSAGLIERLKTQMLDLENKRAELLTKYDPGYRLVKEVETQIQQTRMALQREQKPEVVDRTQSINPLHQSTEAELLRTEALISGLQARRTSLARDLAQSRSRQRNLETITAEHDDLQRRIRVAEENYLLYLKKQEESRLTDALDQRKILNVSVIEKAVPPALPADRHQGFILLLGFLVASFASFGAALLADYFTGVPVQDPDSGAMVPARTAAVSAAAPARPAYAPRVEGKPAVPAKPASTGPVRTPAAEVNRAAVPGSASPAAAVAVRTPPAARAPLPVAAPRPVIAMRRPEIVVTPTAATRRAAMPQTASAPAASVPPVAPPPRVKIPPVAGGPRPEPLAAKEATPLRANVRSIAGAPKTEAPTRSSARPAGVRFNGDVPVAAGGWRGYRP